MTGTDAYTYLRSLSAVRERSTQVFELGTAGKLDYWTVDTTQEDKIVDFVLELIARDYGTNYTSIPPHGRWRHFVGVDHLKATKSGKVDGADRVGRILEAFKTEGVDTVEKARRLVDLMVVSVLLDAGAGNVWKYAPLDGGESIGRSEGLGVASLEIYESGFFSSMEGQPFRVDADGLSKVTAAAVSEKMQVTETNPMDGIEGRANLLVRLGSVISAEKNAAFFSGTTGVGGAADFRPGHIVDYLLNHADTVSEAGKTSVSADALWASVVDGLNDVWPAGRTQLHGKPLGDVWRANSLAATEQSSSSKPAIAADTEARGLVPFHKLSQWMTYSIIEVLENVLNWEIAGKTKMTGLPEYRNGGLLVDFGFLIPNFSALAKSFDVPAPASGSLLDLPAFHASHPAMVEFRAVTVATLDRIAAGINTKLGQNLTLPQVLEAGTWKAGREIAAKLRPETKGPPFNIISDGTIF